MRITLITMDEYKKRVHRGPEPKRTRARLQNELKVSSTLTGASIRFDTDSEGMIQLAGNENKNANKEASFGYPRPAPKPTGGKKKRGPKEK